MIIFNWIEMKDMDNQIAMIHVIKSGYIDMIITMNINKMNKQFSTPITNRK